MNTKRLYRLLIVLLLTAAACSSTPAPTLSPTALPVAAVPPTAAPTAVAPSATAATAPQPAATQPLADNWDDRAIFRAGLIKDEQAALDQLPGASVYHLDVQLADDLASLQGQLQVRYTNQ